MKLLAQSSRNFTHRVASGLVLLSLLFLAFGWAMPPSVGAVAAPQQSSILLEVKAGFDGYYKDSQWVPVRVTVANDGPDVKATLRILTTDSSGSGEIAYAREVELPTQSRRELELYVPLQTYANSINVQLVESSNVFGGGSVLAKNTATVRVVNATDVLFGVVAGTPSAFNIFNSLTPVNGRTYIAQLDLGALPALAAAWQSLDVLVFSDVDTGNLSPEQKTAIASWVASGGKLLVAGGPSWQKTAAGLTDLLPLIPANSQTLPALTSLASFTTEAPPEGSAVVATGSLSPDAVVLVQGETPLVVMRPSGYGKVIYLAADPSFSPLKNWPGLESFYRQLVGGGDDRPAWWGGLRLWYNAYNALNTLPALALPSVFIICGFLGAYLLIIGPVNYFILRRFKRQEWAWLTIPAIVLLFSGLTYVAGYGLRGTRPTLHQLAIVQVWPDAPYARVDQAVGLFSPRRSDYDLAFPAGTLARPMPADNFGGGLSGNYTAQQADQTVFKGVRLDVGEVKPFVVQGLIAAPTFESALTLDFSGGLPTLQGTITNRSNLTLKEVVLLAPGVNQRFSDFAPGQTLNVSLSFYNSRATQAYGTTTTPLIPLAANATSLGGYPSYYSGSYDTTIDDIMGNTNYYNDRPLYRRYMLLSSIIDQYNSGFARGNGVYLVGWTEAAPLMADVVGHNAATENQAIYFLKLTPALNPGTGVVVLPPALMKWSIINANSNSTPTAYDGYIYQGTDYELRFEPLTTFSFKSVQSLTIHFNNYGSTGSVNDPRVDLWNFETSAWETLTGLKWGDTALPEPARFVGPAGEIQVRVQGFTTTGVSFQNLDFTLEVVP